MGSTRLPGKIMKKLGDRSVLGHVISRTKELDELDEVIVATTKSRADDVVELEAKKYDAKTFRGDEFDVLERYYKTAKLYNADNVLRVTSDCP